jgi:serine/threonine-protein kinase HipA
MSLLGASDGETYSYPEMADALRQHGAAVLEDLPQLWRRMVFNILASNTDDHLRNHAVLYAGQRGWRLSPAYDLNPVPIDINPRVLTTTITIDHDPTASLEMALEVAGDFALKPAAAKAVVGEVARSTGSWRKAASKLGLKKGEVERMATAFEHEDARKAESHRRL